MINKSFSISFNVKSILILCILIALHFAAAYCFWEDTTDDAYITFRYAERFIDGKGLTFNDYEIVEGFSNPLWIFVISFISLLLNLSVVTTAKIIGISSALGILIFLSLLSNKLVDNNLTYWLLIFTSMGLLFTPGFIIYSTSGLEVSFLGLLLIASIYFSIAEKKYNIYLAAVLLSMIATIRPEGILYSLFWLIITFKYNSPGFHSLIKKILIVFIPITFYTIFRLIYFGQLLPNTAYAKPSGYYSHIFGVDDTLVYFIILSLPLLIILVYYHFSRPNPKSKFYLLSFGYLLANIIFVIYAGGDWMYFGRFFLPVWPIFLLVFSFSLIYMINSISRNKFETYYLLFLCLISMLLTQVILFKDSYFEYSSNAIYANLMKGNDQVATGNWLNEHIQKGATVATFRLGGISYAAPNLTFYDTFGLTDREVAHFKRTIKQGYDIQEHPVIIRKPDILAIINHNGHRMITVENVRELNAYLENNYDYIKSFKQGIGVTFEIWLNKNERGKILKP